jgi:hypothetical protein
VRLEARALSQKQNSSGNCKARHKLALFA